MDFAQTAHQFYMISYADLRFVMCTLHACAMALLSAVPPPADVTAWAFCSELSIT
jgi:hypothetical protein